MTNRIDRSRRKRSHAPAGKALGALACLALPLVLMPWLVPAFSRLTIGRDYVTYSIQNQLELQLSLRHGAFPLFVPGFAGGTSAAALTLGQIYHPLSHLAARLPGYWEGRALEWNTWLRLLSLGLTHAVLFLLLLRLRLHAPLALGVSLVTVYNLRMLDLFRYGAALEAYTAHLLLCASLLWCACAPTRRLGLLCVVLSTYLLVVSGHPQMMYYGLLGAAVVWMLAPFVVAALRPNDSTAAVRLRFYSLTGMCIATGGLLASAYTLPFTFDFLFESSSRFAQPYEWSAGLQDSWGGLLNNFVRPFYSDVHGAFGGSFLPLAALIAPLGLCFWRRAPVVVWVLLAACVVVLLFALGSVTPVHWVLWKVLPFQSAMRVPGRATLMLPALLMLLLAWALQDNGDVDRKDLPMVRSYPALVWLVPAAVAVVFWLIGNRLPAPGPFHPAALQTIPGWCEGVFLSSGIAAMLALAGSGWLRRGRTVAGWCFVIAVSLQTAVVLAFGTWTTPRQPTPTLVELEAIKQLTLTYPFSFGAGMYPASVGEHLRHTFFAPQLARLYRSAVAVASRQAAYESLGQHREPDRAVIEPIIGQAAAPDLGGIGLTDTPSPPVLSHVRLDYSSFNRLAFNVSSDAPAYLALSFPYTERWRANLNGTPTPLYRANGNELAVRVPVGESRVELRYVSRAALTGAVISALTAICLLAALAASVPAGWPRRAAVVAATLLPATAFTWWFTGLYAADSLGTHYEWRWSPPPMVSNLAFGRPTRMSSLRNPENMHLHHSSRAVDGMLFGEGAATTQQEANPWWQVDLGSSARIGTIIVYEGLRSPGQSLPPFLPLRIGVSDNGTQAHVVHVIEVPSDHGRWPITFPEPLTGRYVTLQSGATAALSLAEVEVYEAQQ